MSILKQQVIFSSFFVSFYFVMTYNSSLNFKLILFLPWTKRFHQSSTCSGENLPNSSCHFPNDKSLFFQILYDSSMTWKIILLYFLSSKNIYFSQKEPIKVKHFETFSCSGQNSSNFSCQFWNYKSKIPLQILHHSSLSWFKLIFFSTLD